MRIVCPASCTTDSNCGSFADTGASPPSIANGDALANTRGNTRADADCAFVAESAGVSPPYADTDRSPFTDANTNAGRPGSGTDWKLGRSTKVLRSEVPISASLQLVDGELWGTMDISTRRIEDLAFKAELQEDGGIRFVIPQEDGDLTFDGKLEDGVITGSFRIGLIGGSFTLERAAPTATPTASTSE